MSLVASKNVLMLVALTVLMVLLLSAPADADLPYDGPAFGEHVAGVAVEGDHLGMEHNPGNHQGVVGWHDHH
ncbi:MAG: hypothetical protein Kow00129_09270 [Thermoleophilia bacterium]